MILSKIAPIMSQLSQCVYYKWAVLSKVPKDIALNSLLIDAMAIASYVDNALELSFRFRQERTSTILPAEILSVYISQNKVSIEFSSKFFDNTIPNSAFVNRTLSVIVIFAKAAKICGTKNFGFRLNLGDIADENEVGFSSKFKNNILIPDPEFICSGGYIGFQNKINRIFPVWHDRREAFLWRGSTTGIPRSSASYDRVQEWYKYLQRTELCWKLKYGEFSSSCDVGITRIVQISDVDVAKKISDHLLGDFIPRDEQVKNKFYIDIDGNSNAWAGLFQAFILGGAVLKIGSAHGFRQWYYDRLHMYENFIPVDSTLDNLEEILDWAKSNPRTCLRIAMEGRKLVTDMRYDETIESAAVRIVEGSKSHI